MQLSIFLTRRCVRNSVGIYGFGHIVGSKAALIAPAACRCVVGSSGLEPPTSRLSGVCSNQLSYEPVMVEVSGFEPLTPCLQGRCSTS